MRPCSSRRLCPPRRAVYDLLRSRRWCEGTPALYFAPHTAPKCHVRHTIYTYSLHFQTAPASSSSLCWKRILRDSGNSGKRRIGGRRQIPLGSCN
ncbi:uncharacterized protein LOC107272826 isoform X4 [Cephus cinctus]|uniref:Uncharacterized protein LOC107272826 isoform X4 n=1 Tax=Cephus cinctus TaxID=211228 RepID=A0AAJ7CAE1_CEPCN|nr:uncharacterized protein LOC107272826 isoform X4 [Cephus cinctus]